MPFIHLAAFTINKKNIAKLSCTIQDLPPVELNDRCKVWMEGVDYETINRGNSGSGTQRQKSQLDTTGATSQVVAENIDLESNEKGAESKPEKLDLMCLHSPVAYNWRQLGEALGIKYGDLESILNNRFRDPDRLSEVLQLWFDKCPSQVTWETIITAVELPPVNNPSVAENMRKFLCK